MEIHWVNYKVILWVMWTILALVAYIPYIQDTIRGSTKPHIYSRVIWTILWAVTTILQWQDGAGAGAWVTWWVTVTCVIVVILALRQWGERDITRGDTIALILSLLSIVVWLWLKNPLWAMIIVLVAEALSFYPTLRKSYMKPFEETLSWYAMAAVRSVFAIWALSQFTRITVMYPAFLILVCGGTVVYIMVRRMQVGRSIEV